MHCYFNGEYCQAGLAAGPESLFLRHGFGFRTSLYHDGTLPRHLEPHLERLYRGMRALGVTYQPAPFEEVIARLLAEAGLPGRSARVDIAYPVERLEERARPLVSVRPWEVDRARTYTLAFYPFPVHSHLLGLPTTNTMHLVLADRHARQAGCDGAALTSPSGALLCAYRARLVFGDGKAYCTPADDTLGASIGLERAAMVLPIKPRRIALKDLPGFAHCWLVSSLLGMRPVTRLGEAAFAVDAKACELADMSIL